MMNLNSPSIQSMLRNTPTPPPTNMQYTFGNTPTVETVYPSPQPAPGNTINVSPYPDPYSMITGAGLANYMPMPTYNFNGALSNGIYRDISQPIMGGVPTTAPISGLPIANYYNPYMGGSTGFYNPYMTFGGPNRAQMERYYRYMNASPNDRMAMDYGFDNYADMQANDIDILSRISIMAKVALGFSQEEIDETKEISEKKIAELKDIAKEELKSSNPFDLSNYQQNSIRCVEVTQQHAIVRKGDEVLYEFNKEGEPKLKKRIYYKVDDCERRLLNSEYTRLLIEYRKEEQHRTAPEREFDNMSLIDYFNEGFGKVNYHYRALEWKNQSQDVTKLFDDKLFRYTLTKEYGSPQMKRKIALMDIANLRGAQQRELDEANGLIRGSYGMLPGGVPLDKGINPNIASSIAVGKDGLHITCPDYIADTSIPLDENYTPTMTVPLLAQTIYSERLDTARARFLNEVRREYGD